MNPGDFFGLGSVQDEREGIIVHKLDEGGRGERGKGVIERENEKVRKKGQEVEHASGTSITCVVLSSGWSDRASCMWYSQKPYFEISLPPEHC